jgi:CRP/FNR family cyclic AMP-dependent transcriptional regulator
MSSRRNPPSGTSSPHNPGTASGLPAGDAARLLGACMLFRGLAADEQKALFSRVHLRTYAAGETIFSMGSPGDNMMAVLSGSVRISVPSPEGREVLLAILQGGEVFGEIALLDNKERTADATALSACHLAILERRDVFAVLDRNPQIWPKIVEVLCARLRNTDQHIAELALLQLPTRLAKVLLRFATVVGQAGAQGGPLNVQLSQRELGNICGTSRESINKCLGAWQRRGIVRIDEGAIVLANRPALEELAELEND